MKKIGCVKPGILFSTLVAVFIAVVCAILMFVILETEMPVLPTWFGSTRVIAVIIFVLFIALFHEFIHIVVASFFVPLKSISLRFRLLVWEVRSSEPFRRNQFLLYVLAPGSLFAILGLVSYMVVNSVNVRYFSALLFIVGFAGAGGDILLALGALKYSSRCYILDNGAEFDILVAE